MSTFHPATSSLQISRVQYRRSLRVDSSFTSQDKNLTFVMASQLELFTCQSYTTHLLSSTRATNEGIAVLEVCSIFPIAIKHILGIKRTFPCSFANKCMHLLTRVRYIISALFDSFTTLYAAISLEVTWICNHTLIFCGTMNDYLLNTRNRRTAVSGI